tara:strand:+ start:290 stop:466 length:177 start_codon:yes stop_codon:yes gene_type:complete
VKVCCFDEHLTFLCIAVPVDDVIGTNLNTMRVWSCHVNNTDSISDTGEAESEEAKVGR